MGWSTLGKTILPITSSLIFVMISSSKAMSSTSFKVWDYAPLAHVFFDFFIACGFYHAPSSFCFYVMFLVLLLIVQWLQAMMLLLLVFPSSPIVLSCDALLAYASWQHSFFELWCSSCLWFLSHSFCFYFYVMFLLFSLVVQWLQVMMFLSFMLIGSPIVLDCDVPFAFVFMWCSYSSCL